MEPFPIDQIIASIEGRLISDEQHKLDRWLAESAENQANYNEIKKVFEATGKLKVDFNPNEHKALQKVNSRLTSKRYLYWIQRSAAAVILLFVVTKAILFISTETKWNELTATSQQIIYLDDSSKIVLAENAHFKYPVKFGSKERKVFLQGRAYFEIKPDKKHPFVISTNNTNIKVLGTKFLVDASNSRQERVVVDEGKVALSPVNSLPEKTVFLTRNEIGTWNATDNQITECENYDANINSALSGRLSFTDTPLKEIIKDLERHYQVKIELTDKSLESRKYTGTFSHVEPEKTLGIISMSLNISVEKNGNIYIIKP